MEIKTIEAVLHLLQDVEPIGVIAMVILVIGLWVWKNPMRPIEKSMEELKSNHLHELPVLIDNSRRTVDILERIEVKLGENFTAIKERLDGK